MENENYPPRPADGALNALWDSPVRELVQLKARALSDADKERHTLYGLLVLALLADFWNGNKRGRLGDYPWRARQKQPDGHSYIGGDYLGHNIACIGVDGRGRIVDFDFNHNQIFDSTVEHAESRLVRRIFSLAHLHDGWLTADRQARLPLKVSATDLSDLTVYTSLEPCAQCAGMMMLGHVREVVYLQSDGGQCCIGNILRNLTEKDGDYYRAPWPVPASQFGFPYFDAQDRGYARFISQVKTTPFFIAPDGTQDTGTSIASYLCTDETFSLVNAGAQTLEALPNVTHAGHRPSRDGAVVANALTNAEVLDQVKRFRAYARVQGKRGTPHQM